MKNIYIKSYGMVFALSVALISGCTRKQPQKDKDLPLKVEIKTLTRSNISDTLNYSGTIEENSSAAISFSTMGMIEKIYVSEGDFVPAGRLLARLDPASAQSMLDAAEASLKQARDAYDRLKSIHDKGSLTDIQMVDIETKLQQAISAYEIAKKNLDNCSLLAPVSGIIGKKMAEAGEFSVVGKAILTILDISSVKIRFSVPESEISAVRHDSRSVITVTALGDKEFLGKKIVKSVQANPVSHTYPAHIILPNPQKELLPGMVCKVALIPEGAAQGLIIPLNLIQTAADGQKFVWTDKDGKAKRTFVTTGIIQGNGVEIKSGLAIGDRIITGGYQKISEDDKINGQ